VQQEKVNCEVKKPIASNSVYNVVVISVNCESASCNSCSTAPPCPPRDVSTATITTTIFSASISSQHKLQAPLQASLTTKLPSSTSQHQQKQQLHYVSDKVGAEFFCPPLLLAQ
jgi:hypothetical protein